MRKRIFRYLCFFAIGSIAVLITFSAVIINAQGISIRNALPELLFVVTVLVIGILLSAYILSRKLTKLRLDERTGDTELNPLHKQIKDQGARLRRTYALDSFKHRVRQRFSLLL